MKVGDRVKVIDYVVSYNSPVGKCGFITKITNDHSNYNIRVELDDGISDCFNEKQLELIEERPERYASREVNGMDVLDLINHWNLNFSEGCILKYLLRDKGEDISDFKKIADYANREVKRLEGCK